MDSNTPSRQSISAPNRAGHEEVEESDNEAENRLSSVQQDNGNLQYRLELVDILGMTKLYHAETETARRLPARDRLVRRFGMRYYVSSIDRPVGDQQERISSAAHQVQRQG